MGADFAIIPAYYEIGRQIIENEQQGKYRAQYGAKILQQLSLRLAERFGKDDDARSFYEIEAVNEQWSVETLSRQIGTSLYERLALTLNKDKVFQLSTKGHVVEKLDDVIKNPPTGN